MTYNLSGQEFYVDSDDVAPHDIGGFRTTTIFPSPVTFPTTEAQRLIVRNEVRSAFDGWRDTGIFPVFESMRDLMDRARQLRKTEIQALRIRLLGLVHRDLESLGPEIGYTYPAHLEGKVYIAWNRILPQNVTGTTFHFTLT